MSARSTAITETIMAQARADAALMLLAEEIRRRRVVDSPGRRMLRAIWYVGRTVASGGWE